MAIYKLSEEAKNDLIRLHHSGVEKFGMTQADKYFNSFFDHFDLIARRPFSFEAVNHTKHGYRSCVFGSDSIYFKLSGNQIEIMTIIRSQDLGR